jgi:hypothetical protein
MVPLQNLVQQNSVKETAQRKAQQNQPGQSCFRAGRYTMLLKAYMSNGSAHLTRSAPPSPLMIGARRGARGWYRTSHRAKTEMGEVQIQPRCLIRCAPTRRTL